MVHSNQKNHTGIPKWPLLGSPVCASDLLPPLFSPSQLGLVCFMRPSSFLDQQVNYDDGRDGKKNAQPGLAPITFSLVSCLLIAHRLKEVSRSSPKSSAKNTLSTFFSQQWGHDKGVVCRKGWNIVSNKSICHM